MPITEIIQPEEKPDELLLTDTAPANEGDESIEATIEPIDEEAFPDTFDEEPHDPTADTPLIKDLREKLKQANREKAQLLKQVAPTALVRMPKPELFDDTCDGDTDKFEAALLSWQTNERAVDEQERARTTEQQNLAQSWQQELQTYKTKAVALGKPDFEAAESTVIATLSDAQQTTIVMAASDPARFIYALGRSPQRLAQLAQITNPIKLAAEVARIEGRSIMARKEPPPIDTPLRGNGRLSNEPDDKKEASLLAAAERDPSKFEAYRSYMKTKKAQAA